MDRSNILIDCEGSQREDVEVGHGDGDDVDDDSRWVSEIRMYFSCVEKVKTYYQEYVLKKEGDSPDFLQTSIGAISSTAFFRAHNDTSLTDYN
ncbi:hypothetical protein RYX36_014232 [Vicia faba]